jgi:hypothetical protein
VVLAVSCFGFLLATPLGGGLAAPAITLVSVRCTLGEIMYAGSATALVVATAPPHLLGRALARFQLSTGRGLAVSPALMTTLAGHGPATLWGSLAAVTLPAAATVRGRRAPAGRATCLQPHAVHGGGPVTRRRTGRDRSRRWM